MSEAAEKLTAALLELPLAERLEVMDALAASLTGPPAPFVPDSDEFGTELDRRRAEHESGADPGVPATDFFRGLRERRGK
ncbi:addiction module protein [Gemmata sp. JC717]|uniref:addiction module protein n=1 Tax=Gemmata algarum TaxID=2975278 RepID=UPI0021BB3ED2|nr:addiction module protein [Gemmata algarum]MDY3554644.1 addiction module protein [Gemmata algarum]